MKQKLLIGTKNPAKLKRWSYNFGEYFDIVSLKDVGIDIEVEESLTDLIGNSQKKSKIYSSISGLLTLSDDTGFYIEELDGLPGVAVRRWGGEIPNEISDQEFIEFFRTKIMNLKNLNSYFKYAISISTPEGYVDTIESKLDGIIDINRLGLITPKDYGYPISLCFVDELTGKTYSECNDEERYMRDKSIIDQVKFILTKYL